MATIMYKIENGKMRVCNATCHNADINSKCTCICGGKYHGNPAAVEAVMHLAKVEAVRSLDRLFGE